MAVHDRLAPVHWSRFSLLMFSERCLPNRRLLAGLIGLLALLASAVASAGVLHPGHSGHWFVPERSGEGWVLEILDEQRALVYWFTYDEAGNQRWLIGEGTIREDDEGWYLDFPDMYLTRGPAFGPDYDSSSLVIEVVGDGEMRFTDCDHGLFEFEGLDQDLAFPVQRLTRTMGADCSAPLHGRPGEPLQPYAGHSGSWYEPASSGQGFALQWMTNDHAVVTWFTYDTEGNQQWMFGVGRREDDRVVFSDLHATRGGRFGEDFDPDSVERLHWGDLELELSCHGGPARYASDRPEFGSGTLDLNRLTRLMWPEGCPAEAPQFDELYELSYSDVPLRNESDSEFSGIRVKDISADGTLVGAFEQTFRVMLADSDEWQAIEQLRYADAIFVSADSRVAAFNADTGFNEDGTFAPDEARLWYQDSGVQQLPGQELVDHIVLGMSHDGQCLVGTGRKHIDGLQIPWKWNADEEQQQVLPTPDGVGMRPSGCASDSNVVIGRQLTLENGGWVESAIRWVGDAKPESLHDDQGARLRYAQACSADCDIVVGGDQAILDSDHPHFREPWYWSEEQGAVYLGMPQDEQLWLVLSAPVQALDVSSDGSVIVGAYAVEDPQDGGIGTRAFIWTQWTGVLVVSELLAAGGVGDANWRRMSAISVAGGDEGIRILLKGARRHSDHPGNSYRAGVLHLTPKRDLWFE